MKLPLAHPTVRLCAVAMLTAATPALVHGAAVPTAADAPRALADLACAQPRQGGGLNLDLLTPQLNMPLPQIDRALVETIRARQLVDPNGLCRYRDANRALPPPTPQRVVYIGDSITDGWLAAAPSLFSADVLNRGIAGQNTSQMLLRFREDVLNLRPRVVHIMGGVNDINTPAGAVLTRSNISSMVELALANNIKVVLATITPSSRFWSAPDVAPGPQIAELNRWLADYAAAKGLTFVDYYTPLHDGRLGLKEALSNEGLHPNQRGYDAMTPLARAAVAQALAIAP